LAVYIRRSSRILLIIFVFLGGALAGSVVALNVMGPEVAAEDPADPAAERPENLRRLEQLADLPYLTGVAPASDSERGVVKYERSRTWDGLNFFNCLIRPGANLVDMEGKRVFEWLAPDPDESWFDAKLLPSGDVLVLVDGYRVMRVTLNGDVRWEYRAKVHHDIAVAENGEIFVLARTAMYINVLHPKVPVFNDEIHVLDRDGNLIRKISILEALLRSPFGFLLPSSHDLEPDESQPNLVLDVLHSNHVQVLDGAVEHLSPLFRRGNLLVSMRTINSIGILDPDESRFVWLWGPTNIARQHHPTLLPNGHILLFDNGQSASQIIELDPLTNAVVWRYAPLGGFYSESAGSVQRLPNGNTLITESDPGVVFEVTPDGDTVWRYVNPLTTADGLRQTIWRMTRFDPQELHFLDQPSPR
jgi:hypothetical protein